MPINNYPIAVAPERTRTTPRRMPSKGKLTMVLADSTTISRMIPAVPQSAIDVQCFEHWRRTHGTRMVTRASRSIPVMGIRAVSTGKVSETAYRKRDGSGTGLGSSGSSHRDRERQRMVGKKPHVEGKTPTCGARALRHTRGLLTRVVSVRQAAGADYIVGNAAAFVNDRPIFQRTT